MAVISISILGSPRSLTSGPVLAETESGASFSFDLIGSDEVSSIVQRALFPSVKPGPPPTNCAHRAVIPYSQIRKDTFLAEIVSKCTIEIWMAPHAYIITYPISAGRDFNMVLSRHRPNQVTSAEDVDINDLRNGYRNSDPCIRKTINMQSVGRLLSLARLIHGPLLKKTWC